ncbi:COP9 signalosome complex subunit 8 [Drosophila subpulchrella]|uniref:COP9 signalosome complex subunit 8 n=1 Tax=Drosophila subpulchrella TaxID=1486046 RepID=UPI0018A12B72|nr:COP9 signalosome complex subunit 8 [Drosophila subpulchrella]
MHLNKYSELQQRLENEEFEQVELGADVYQQLLAIYLYQNKLADAKLLWMRIPNKLKEDKELIQLNLLNVALQNNNYADFFRNIKYEWSERVKAPVEDLLIKQREELFKLMGSAYVSIYQHNVLELSLMSDEELKNACAALNWTEELDGDRVILKPKVQEAPPSRGNDDQLLKLTEFVTFLEN